MTQGDADSNRRAFRAWVRAHHPDAGGDPGAFAAGLARWRGPHAGGPIPGGDVPGGDVPGGDAPAAEVSVFRARHGLWHVQRWWRRRRQGPRVF